VGDLRKLAKEIEAQRAKGQVTDVDPEAFAEIENKSGLKGIEDKFKKADSAIPRPPARERMKAAMSDLDGMKKGGKVRTASQRADGIAVRGKTRA
jgi:hypothetical protein